MQHIKPYFHKQLWVHGKRTNFIKLPNGYIPFGNVELFLSSGESKILCKRLVEKNVSWEDEGLSNNVVKVKNKGKKRARRSGVSDAVPNGIMIMKMLKENSRDVKKQNLVLMPPKRVAGMYEYMVNCALEPPTSQADPLTLKLRKSVRKDPI